MEPSSPRKRSRLSQADYKVACLVPLGVEAAPLRAMLDEIHDDIPLKSNKNAYILGRLGLHNIVLAILPATGNNDSGVVAAQLMNDFPGIRFGLLVGVAGGIPGVDGTNDIRLGDVVVSEPKDACGGVVQFDKGRRHTERFQLLGHLAQPLPFLVATAKKLKAQHLQEGHRLQISISDMIRRHPQMKDQYVLPGVDRDCLYETSYEHIEGDDCRRCDPARTVKRLPRQGEQIKVHYGTIGSSNIVLRDAVERDRLGLEHKLLCVEMEAAGVMNILPCLVIRGICDYADSHKSKQWQPYAASVAAAYAKELLHNISPEQVSDRVQELACYPTQIIHDRDDALPSRDERDRMTESTEALYKTLLNSLTFVRMDARLRNVEDALPKTCEWLFHDKDFQDWSCRRRLEETHGFFWIKGKPGSGKSTLMKTALRRHQKKWRQEVNVSYFFNARARTDLEKSSSGFYRSLTHQLLCAYPQLKPLFIDRFESKEAHTVVEDWSDQELKSFIGDFIRTSQELRAQPLNVFVDALDEGVESDVRQMICFLEDLASEAQSISFPLRVCLSSRHFPHISIRKGFVLRMEDQHGHRDDIKQYIQTKFTAEDSIDMLKLKTELSRKSAGVFLWVVLVVRLLRVDHDQGTTAKQLTRALDNIPEELDDLFARILEKSNQSSKECLLSLQWVLFSRRALSPVELLLAVRSSLVPSQLDQEEKSVEELHLYLLNTTRGLVEVTKSDPINVQFIHETVRDFLQRKGLTRIDASLQDHVEGCSHEILKQGCLQYMKHAACSGWVQWMHGYTKFDTGKARELALTKLPFVDYAVNRLLEHANLAENFGVSQTVFLKSLLLDRELFQFWIRARNMFQDFIVRMHTTHVSLLYVLVEQDFLRLTTTLINLGVDINTTCGRYGSALQAACASGSMRAVNLLLDAGADINANGGEFGHALFTAIHYKKEGVIRLLVSKGARPSHEAMVKCLFKTLARAYWLGTETLLDIGVGLDCINSRQETPLLWSATRGNVPLVNLLIKKAASVGFVLDDQRDSSLVKACWEGHEQIVHILLEAGADVNTVNKDGETALRNACFLSHEQIVRLLIEAGADVNTVNKDGETALRRACFSGREPAVRLLIKAGADVNAVNKDGETALRRACYFGYEHIVRLLIKAGADVNAVNKDGETALRRACFFGYEHIVRLLIEAGADANTINKDGETALKAACT